MNVKVAHLIAVQLGIFVGIMSWLVFARLESAQPRTAEEMQNSTVDSSATVAPVFKPRSPHPYSVEYGIDREPAQPMDEEPAPTTQGYDQEIATKPYARSGVENGSIAVDSPYYAQVAQAPAVVPSDSLESAQTVAYAEPFQTVVYAQPAQIVVFSNSRPFANRRRLTPQFDGARRMITPRRPERGGSHLGRGGVMSRRNSNPPSCWPGQVFGPRGNR